MCDWRCRIALVLLLASGLPDARPSRAASIARTQFRQMVASSSAIVHGRVASTVSRWNEEHTMIVTDVRVQVTDALKGAVMQEIVVTQPGGTVGNLKVEVPGSTAFRPGEEAVLLLAPGGHGNLYVQGLDQGRLDVVTEAKTGHKVVQGLSPEAVNSLSGAVHGRVLSATVGGPVELGSFLNGMRALIHDVDTKGGK